MKLPRAPLFLAERVISQGGGLLFTAVLARTAETAEAAAFLAAYAFAAVFQPVLASAVQPIAARHWRTGGLGAVIRIWAIMQLSAIFLIGPLIWLADGRVEAFILLHAALAPGLLMATPLAAEDRRKTLVLILITAAVLGTTARVGAYLLTGDLALSALFFAFEPVVGGAALLMAARRVSPSAAAAAPPSRPFLREAAVMAAAMVATTVFWRSPVLLADAYLGPEDVIALALAMQVVMGLCLPANALCQSLFGPIAKGDGSAVGVGLWIALTMMIGAPLILVMSGEWIMFAIYGPIGQGAAAYAVMLAPMAGMVALLRLTHIIGGLNGLSAELALTRTAALGGQAALVICLLIAPSAFAIAIATPISLLLATVAAPLMAPDLAAVAREALTSARQIALHATARQQAIRLMFS